MTACSAVLPAWWGLTRTLRASVLRAGQVECSAQHGRLPLTLSSPSPVLSDVRRQLEATTHRPSRLVWPTNHHHLCACCRCLPDDQIPGLSRHLEQVSSRHWTGPTTLALDQLLRPPSLTTTGHRPQGDPHATP